MNDYDDDVQSIVGATSHSSRECLLDKFITLIRRWLFSSMFNDGILILKIYNNQRRPKYNKSLNKSNKSNVVSTDSNPKKCDKIAHQIFADILLRLFGLLVAAFQRIDGLLQRLHQLRRCLLTLAEQRHLPVLLFGSRVRGFLDDVNQTAAFPLYSLSFFLTLLCNRSNL